MKRLLPLIFLVLICACTPFEKIEDDNNKTKQEMQMMCVYAIRLQLNVVINKPIKLTYTFYEPDAKRDLGNILFVDKIFEDAMQVCGVIKNDNQAFVKGIVANEVKIDRVNPRVEIEIEEL